MPLPTPIGRQREVLYLASTGHAVVLGTAGSGKTTLALLRAKYLSKFCENAGKTLLVTYNRMLRTYLNSWAEDDLEDVDIRNYHEFARGYLSFRGMMPAAHGIIQENTRRIVISAVIHDFRGKLPKSVIHKVPDSAIDEEIQWISKMGFQSENAYQEAERWGRGGLRLTGRQRQTIWAIREEYLSRRQELLYDYDWDDLSSTVLSEMTADKDPRMYKHIVIDEGQDLSPVMLRSLVAAVPPDGSIIFFGDVAQQIYGGRMSWRDAGLRIKKVWEFQENYRNTRQISAFALAVAERLTAGGAADMVVPRAPRADGPKPALVRCPSRVREQSFVARRAANLAKAQNVAILFRRRDDEQAYIQSLVDAGADVGRLHRTTAVWQLGPRVWVGTYHSAKGLEFDAVILPQLDSDVIPDRPRLEAVSDKEVGLAEETRLLYVAITRAKSTLILCYSKELTPLLDGIDPALYDARTLSE